MRIITRTVPNTPRHLPIEISNPPSPNHWCATAVSAVLLVLVTGTAFAQTAPTESPSSARHQRSGDRVRSIQDMAIARGEQIQKEFYAHEPRFDKPSFPFEEILNPEPIPRYAQHSDGPDVRPAGFLVSKNLLTGDKRVLDVPLLPPADFSMPWSMGEGTEFGTEPNGTIANFSGLTLVQNPEQFPWRVNVKLVYRKSDKHSYVCSGTLIDPMHVLTAGHCVNEGGLLGFSGDWVTDMLVIPALNGQWPNSDTVGPYGGANGTILYSWSGWTEWSDSDHDMGFILLDRPIGALTGWHAFSWVDLCSFYTVNTFHSAGYPAEDPYLDPGLFMYYWSGTFDSCETIGNEIGFARDGYGGQSGSSIYFQSGDTRTIYAVLTNLFAGTTWSTRVTSEKHADIVSTIATDRAPSADFIPLDVNVSPSSLAAGERLSALNYLVHNYSEATWNGTITVHVYLSTDDNIDGADVLISTRSFTSTFDPLESIRVTATQNLPIIPADTQEGTYFVGIILLVDDYNSNNNVTGSPDVASIVVGPCNAPPAAASPIPVHGAINVSVEADLDWANVPEATYDVYFGTDPTPDIGVYRGSTNVSSWSLSSLQGNTTYYWRIDTVNQCGTTTGSLWSFTTTCAPGSTCGDDGNSCTNDIYDANCVCTHPPNSAACNDGISCNGSDTCGGGSCSIHTGNTCPKGMICNEAVDSCVTPLPLPVLPDPTTLPRGSIVAWGQNGFGQTDVPGPNANFIGIAAGSYHSLGLKSNGSIVAWGCLSGPDSGQCSVPAPNTGFVAVSAGEFNSLGLKVDGSIVGWGGNYNGETSVPVPNSNFIGIDTTAYHSLGLKDDGSIVAWGWNDYGQTNVPSPNSGFVAIAAGLFHSLGLKADGSIVAWGSGYPGNPPEPNAGFVGVAAGVNHSLGLRADGTIVAWGWNDYGQDNVPSPNTGFVAVSEGAWHSLGLKDDGSIVAWGCGDWADFGQCNVPAPNTGFEGVTAGGSHSLAIRRSAGDADGDGDVDWADFAAFSDYLLGPSVDPQLFGWPFFDVDMDGDVDLRDLAAWQNAFTGP